MRIKPRTEKRSGGAVAAVIAVPLLIAGYVLGIGPALRLAYHDWCDVDTVLTVYSPVIGIAKKCRPMELALNGYVDLWLPDEF